MMSFVPRTTISFLRLQKSPGMSVAIEAGGATGGITHEYEAASGVCRQVTHLDNLGPRIRCVVGSEHREVEILQKTQWRRFIRNPFLSLSTPAPTRGMDNMGHTSARQCPRLPLLLTRNGSPRSDCTYSDPFMARPSSVTSRKRRPVLAQQRRTTFSSQLPLMM